MTTIYIVSFYANITGTGTRFYHCRCTDKEGHVAVKKLF